MLQKQYSRTSQFRCALLPPGFLLELFFFFSQSYPFCFAFAPSRSSFVILSSCLLIHANHINYISPVISAFVIVEVIPLHSWTVQGSEIVESPK